MEKSGFFQIGDMARLFHLSVGTLRHYEKLGLLCPEYIDPETGYRYYSTRQFETLNTIRYLRVLDTPLEQIGIFLKNREVNHIQELLRQQKKMVIRKRRELETIERKIDNRLRQIEDAASSELNVIRMITCPSRRITWIHNPLSLRSSLDLEIPIRQLEANQKEAFIFLGKIGVGITQEHLDAQEYQKYDMVFLFLDPEDDFDGETEELPAETCAVLRFCGDHTDAPAQYQKLAAFIKEHHLKIAGFSKEITMIDYGITNDTEQFVTEIQIPTLPEESTFP
ncbi:MAG: MerR family transcriptional regulator [Candidatus Limivivens sp.]|nr:MerR family transcriptional regulator [Candidatus Limivivens sp.]